MVPSGDRLGREGRGRERQRHPRDDDGLRQSADVSLNTAIYGLIREHESGGLERLLAAAATSLDRVDGSRFVTVESW